MEFKQYVYVRVNSFNSFGWSVDGQPSTESAIILTEPIKMATPIYDPKKSPGSLVYVTIKPLVAFEEIGGNTVDSYQVEMSVNGSGVWTVIQGGDNNYSVNLEIVTSGHTLGETMLFRAKAHNIQGWGQYSEPLSVVVSSMPEQPIAPVITIENFDVRISWTAPNSNFGQISSYIITINH